MKFIETRGNDGQPRHPVSVEFSQAILGPIASYGGIYAPESLPDLGLSFLEAHLQSDYKQLAKAILLAFEIDIEESVIDEALSLYDHFDDAEDPTPLAKLREDLFVSELYHGPTRAFKDMALQPFGVLLSALARKRDEEYLILAATSGDTGPAALETFKNRDRVRVACMYPEGGTSDVQRLQMITEDADNLKVIGIHGHFDDAQAALKSLLGSAQFKATLQEKKIHLSAANSVNFGRIIFQIIYHIHAYLELVRNDEITMGDSIYLAVPSGNFGNALGGYYAIRMGLPIEKLLISTNNNNVLKQLINHGRYDFRDSSVISTLSPAMDILKASNVERVLFDLFGAERTRELMKQLDDEKFYELSEAEHNQLKQYFIADDCDDVETIAYIKDFFEEGYVMDPHTATCIKTFDTCREKNLKTVVTSTAEWTKFSMTIADAIGVESGSGDLEALNNISAKADIKIPEQIEALFDKPVAQKTLIDKADIEKTILSFL
ncbi:threonine synthase [Leucothrix pacifica]|uniref:Threonine synthase n=1 Tax=Leucothrix pacifica TaxID=1247513 RepID=A0A317C9X7_9GAMM|nr:threonine synthase [Leucothrix pacifica]PWQ94971.1 threonine synthase [Leucothrix pacifica]